jgi:hypothetical protein
MRFEAERSEKRICHSGQTPFLSERSARKEAASVFMAIWNFLGRVVGVILPVGKSFRIRGLSAGVRWTLHILVLLIVLVVLYFLSKPLLGWALESQSAQKWWLPVFFLLIYVLAWASWWLYKLLSTEEESSVFPDIDEAWTEAVQGLDQAGLGLTDLPLFLVLGRTEAPEDELFKAAKLQLVVRQTPGRAAPLHVYASRDAIYITCAGASLLGRQATILAVEGLPEIGAGAPPPDEFDASKTLKPGAGEKKVIKLMKTVGRQATALERRQLRREGGFKLPDLLKNPAEVELQTARLEHLCRLIVRDRRPYVPVNGLVVLVPLGGTDTDSDAQATGELIQRDLTTLQDTLKVHCPMFGLVCDLETLPGFREFISALPVKDRERRLGQRFPLAPDVNGEPLLELVDSSVQWLCGNLLRDWVFKLLRVEVAGKDDLRTAVSRNTKLYLLLNEIRERRKRLSRIVKVALTRQAAGPLLFGGCYLAGTGRDPDREQALVAGLFQRLLQEQDYVSWTDRALADDASAERLTKVGYGALAGAGVVALALIVFVVMGKRL